MPRWFVNPYAFVPLGSAKRIEPSGHELLAEGNYSGSFAMTLTSKSRVLLGAADGGQAPPRNAYGDIIINGGSLSGSIRSLHEALTGSCLRVTDPEFVPRHRHAVTGDLTVGLKMAVVREWSPAGLPTQVELCDDVLWIDREYLKEFTSSARKHGLPPLSTGDLVSLPNAEDLTTHEYGKAKVFWRGAASGPKLVRDESSQRSLLITETGTRELTDAYFAGGIPSGERVSVTAAARRDLGYAMEGAADQHGNEPRSQEVRHGGDMVGNRLRVGMPMRLGTPLWVEMDFQGVDEERDVSGIGLSQSWRYPGMGTMSSQSGRADPCHGDPWTAKLCPSCQVFGSAGDDEEPTGATVQSSDAGRVRFKDAVARAETVRLESNLERAPLNSPKPSAGQIYLCGGRDGQMSPSAPLAHWQGAAREASGVQSRCRAIRSIGDEHLLPAHSQSSWREMAVICARDSYRASRRRSCSWKQY